MNEIIEVKQADMLEAINRSEIDLQIATAKSYPRDVNKVLAHVRELAMQDESVAKECFYAVKRGTDEVEGVSVRLAEILASVWGNLRCAARIIGNDGKTITAQGVCHDLESNTAISVEVMRRITTKEGRTFSDDMQVVTGNAACAIAFRNAVLKVIPKAITGGLINEIKAFSKKKLESKPEEIGFTMKKWLAYYAAVGVSKEMVDYYLGSDTDNPTSEMIMKLQGAYTAVKEGSSTLQELFITPYNENKAAANLAAKTMQKVQQARSNAAKK